MADKAVLTVEGVQTTITFGGYLGKSIGVYYSSSQLVMALPMLASARPTIQPHYHVGSSHCILSVSAYRRIVWKLAMVSEATNLYTYSIVKDMITIFRTHCVPYVIIAYNMYKYGHCRAQYK